MERGFKQKAEMTQLLGTLMGDLRSAHVFAGSGRRGNRPYPIAARKSGPAWAKVFVVVPDGTRPSRLETWAKEIEAEEKMARRTEVMDSDRHSFVILFHNDQCAP
jgi:hypothetical protein